MGLHEHEYECGKCGLRFGRHWTRSAARRSGQAHRDEAHGGAHPIEESILTYSGGRMPSAADWPVFALFAALLLAGLVSKAIG